MKAVVILGCDGRQDEEFHFCNGVENIVVDLEKAQLEENYLDLIKYLDKVAGVFDGICFSMNKISNSMYKMHELGFISEKQYQYVTHFYQLHQRCGLKLYAKPSKERSDER